MTHSEGLNTQPGDFRLSLAAMHQFRVYIPLPSNSVIVMLYSKCNGNTR